MCCACVICDTLILLHFTLFALSPLNLLLPPSSVPAEIIMHEGVTAVYRSNVDLFFYVLGSQSENEVS